MNKSFDLLFKKRKPKSVSNNGSYFKKNTLEKLTYLFFCWEKIFNLWKNDGKIAGPIFFICNLWHFRVFFLNLNNIINKNNLKTQPNKIIQFN